MNHFDEVLFHTDISKFIFENVNFAVMPKNINQTFLVTLLFLDILKWFYNKCYTLMCCPTLLSFINKRRGCRKSGSFFNIINYTFFIISNQIVFLIRTWHFDEVFMFFFSLITSLKLPIQCETSMLRIITYG